MAAPARLSSPGRRAAGLLLGLVVVGCGQLVAAAPATAHAELVQSTPRNGQTLEVAPEQVLLRFTESVVLVEDGLRLLDAAGRPVPTPPAAVHGAAVHWPMPERLADGSYLVSWRVVSRDSHPVSGAFAFAVGARAAVAPAVEPDTRGATPPSWPVTVARLGGYTGFVLVAGGLACAVLCWPAGRADPGVRRLLHAGVGAALAATAAGFLLQGPWASGEPLRQVLDPELVVTTAGTPYGQWMLTRLGLLLALAAAVWPAGALHSPRRRWFAGATVCTVAWTFPATGHAAPAGLPVWVADAVHVLVAGAWVGGLVALLAGTASRHGRPDAAAWQAFSTMALLSVAALVLTGSVNALAHLHSVDQLWSTPWGAVLTAKLVLVAAAVGVGALSRGRLRGGGLPRRTVRGEVVIAVGVLAATAVLTSTAPPGRFLPEKTTSAHGGHVTGVTVHLDLGAGRHGVLRVADPTPGGSDLRLEVRDGSGRPLRVRSATLAASLTARDLGPIDVPLRRRSEEWVGRFAFPLAGTWQMTLTVETPSGAAWVTAGRLRIRSAPAGVSGAR